MKTEENLVLLNKSRRLSDSSELSVLGLNPASNFPTFFIVSIALGLLVGRGENLSSINSGILADCDISEVSSFPLCFDFLDPLLFLLLRFDLKLLDF